MKHLLTGLFIFFCSIAFSQGAWDRWVTTSGTNTYTATVTVPTFPSSYNNTVLRLKFPNGNTGASTINVNSTGAIPIRKWDGNSWEPLVSGDIPANSSAILYYDNTNGYYSAIIFESIGGAVSTPTLQEVLTAGSNLTSSHTITVNSNDLTLSEVNDFIITTPGGVSGFRVQNEDGVGGGGIDFQGSIFKVNGDAGSAGQYFSATNGWEQVEATEVTNTPAGGIAATTAQAAINELDTEKAPLASPTFTGTPTAPTPSPGDNSTKIATTAYVDALTVLPTGSIIVGAGGVSTPFAIGSANQLLGVNTVATTVEYKTVDNGLTAASGTIKWGGALTAATSITGAFDLTYSNARYSKTSTFTTTASGQIMNTYTGTITTRATTSDDVISTRFSPTISMGAASQTATAFSLTPTLNTNNLIASTFTGFDYNPTITVGSGSLGTHYAFRATSGNVVIGNTTGLSGDRLSVYGVANNLIARFLNSAGSNRFLFNDNGSTLFVTGATSSSLDVHTLSPNFTAASGSPINKAVVISPTINQTGSATGTIFGIHYNPTLTSVTGLTHYGVVVAPTAALNGFGTSTPTATVHVVGSTKLQGSVLNSTGLQHERITTGSIGAGSTALITVTWDVAFPDTNYTVMASVEDATTSSLSLSVVHVESKSTTDATVRVINNAVGSLTGTLHIMAIHD